MRQNGKVKAKKEENKGKKSVTKLKMGQPEEEEEDDEMEMEGAEQNVALPFAMPQEQEETVAEDERYGEVG